MKNSPSSVKKGDDYENRALKIIKKLIQDSQISHLPEYIKIYTKKDKGYYSSLREKDIFFDITIEVWPPNAKRSSFTYFIECKNYNAPIPVGQISKFAEDVREVAGLNCKAIFIANKRLQEGGYNIAKNIGMMLIQGESIEDFKIILDKSSQVNFKDSIPILISTFDSSVIDEQVKPLEKLIDDVIRNAFKEIKNNIGVKHNIDKLNKTEITIIAEEELKRFYPQIFETGIQMDINNLKAYLKNIYDIKIEILPESSASFGNCDFEKNTIGINSTIINTNRELFVLGHEIGHYLLHQNLKIDRVTYQSFEDSKENFITRKRDLNNPKNWIEWQANYFSSSFILPRIVFLARLYKYQDLSRVNRGKIYLDDQLSNQKIFTHLVSRLSIYFNVSKTSIIYKLKEMDLILNKSRLKTVGQIINEM